MAFIASSQANADIMVTVIVEPSLFINSDFRVSSSFLSKAGN